MGRRLGVQDILALPACGKGLLKGVTLLGNKTIAIEELNVIADTLLTPGGARLAREALDMQGETCYQPNHADLFSEHAGEPIMYTADYLDHILPGEAMYGDTNPDGSGWSISR